MLNGVSPAQPVTSTADIDGSSTASPSSCPGPSQGAEGPPRLPEPELGPQFHFDPNTFFALGTGASASTNGGANSNSTPSTSGARTNPGTALHQIEAPAPGNAAQAVAPTSPAFPTPADSGSPIAARAPSIPASDGTPESTPPVSHASQNAESAQAAQKGRSSKVDGKNDLDKAVKEQAENNEQTARGTESGSEGGDVIDDQTNITNPDDDRGRRLYAKATFNQRSKTDQKHQELKVGGQNLGTLAGKGDVRTNERVIRVYAGDTTNVALSEDLKAGEHQSVEGDRSYYAGFAGAQLQQNLIAARYEGNVDKGPVRVKPKAEALVGVNAQLEAQAQLGRNPNVQVNGQFFAGARVDGEVGLEVFNQKLRKPKNAGDTPAGSGTPANDPKRLLKLKARADASVGAQANVSAIFGRAQKNGETITGAGGSVDLFAGARARGKLTAEAGGVGVAAQVSALAGVGITATAGLKKEGGTYTMTHGFGAALGVGASVLHEVTFNPALLKEAISGAIPKLRGSSSSDESRSVLPKNE